MNRAQRAGAAAAGIVPITIVCTILAHCGCSFAAWVLEIVTASAYVLWIMLGKGIR